MDLDNKDRVLRARIASLDGLLVAYSGGTDSAFLAPVTTRWGRVRVKESRLMGTLTNFCPEYLDCRQIAESNGVPLKLVQQEATAAYLCQTQGATCASAIQTDASPAKTSRTSSDE